MLIHASRTRSSVGLTKEPGGAVILRPRHRPATIRTAVRRLPSSNSTDQRALRSMGETDVGDLRLEITLAAVVVTLQSKGDGHLGAGLKLGGPGGEIPAKRVQRSGAGVQDEFEPMLTNDSRWPGDGDVPGKQHRRRVSNPERLEMAEQRFDASVEAVDAHFEIDTNLRDEIGRGQQRARDFVEARCEIRHLVASDTDARRSTVTAVTNQVLTRFAKGAVQIELWYRTPGTLALFS